MSIVRAVASSGLGFLLAVLWFDLMFDVQVRAHGSADSVPESVLVSIAGYYRRVTTDARPMNRVVALAMLATIGALVGEVVADAAHRVAGSVALALAGIAIGLAGARTVRNAIRLGARTDPIADQSSLARLIFRDHVACLALVVVALIVHVFVSA